MKNAPSPSLKYLVHELRARHAARPRYGVKHVHDEPGALAAKLNQVVGVRGHVTLDEWAEERVRDLLERLVAYTNAGGRL